MTLASGDPAAFSSCQQRSARGSARQTIVARPEIPGRHEYFPVALAMGMWVIRQRHDGGAGTLTLPAHSVESSHALVQEPSAAVAKVEESLLQPAGAPDDSQAAATLGTCCEHLIAAIISESGAVRFARPAKAAAAAAFRRRRRCRGSFIAVATDSCSHAAAAMQPCSHAICIIGSWQPTVGIVVVLCVLCCCVICCVCCCCVVSVLCCLYGLCCCVGLCICVVCVFWVVCVCFQN